MRISHPANVVGSKEAVAVAAHAALKLRQSLAVGRCRVGIEIFVGHRRAAGAAVPKAFGKRHHAVYHAVVQCNAAFVVDAHIIPQAQNSAKRLGGVGHFLSASLVLEGTHAEEVRVVIVQIAHKRVDVALGACNGFGIRFGSAVPYLANGAWHHRQTGVPHHGYASAVGYVALRPTGKSFGVIYAHLVAANVYIRAKRCRYLLQKLVKAFAQCFHALLRLHGESHGSGERFGVTGHVNLGNHSNAALAGVGTQFAYFIVGVEFTFVATASLIFRVVELRKAAALDAPRWAVGEMPVKHIQPV